MTGYDCLYKQWLGVEAPNPSFYDLFEIGADEQDLQVIKEAADRALSKVRSFKPGAQAKQWAMLLDELEFALKTLTDSDLRSAYDQQLERGELVAALRVESSASPESEQQPTAEPAEQAESTEHADLAEQDVSQTNLTPETHAPDDAEQSGISNSLDMVPTGATELDPMAPLDLTPNGVAGDPMAPVDIDAITAVPPQPELVTPAAIQPSSPSLVVEEETTTSSAAAYHAKSKSRSKGVWIATGVLGVAIAGIIITLQVLPDSDTDTNNVAQNQNGQSESSDSQTDDEGQQSQDPSDNSEGEGGGTKPDEPNQEPTEEPDNKPEPEPQPMPEPEPVPEPEPEPEPAPEPEPEPEPEPTAPTAEELQMLSAALKAGREALQQRELSVATKSAATALSLAKLDEHVEVAQRLHDMVEYTTVFYRLFNEALGKVEIGSGLTIGTSIEAGVAEITPDTVTLRINGDNRSWTRDELPAGVVLAFANKYFTEFQMAPVIKGAFLISQPKPLESHVEQAVKLFAEGAANGAPSEGLEQFLEDSYDFTSTNDDASDDTDKE